MTAEQRAALESVISVDKAVMHGTPCFRGTRVPVQTLIDFLETGETVDAFLAVYACVRQERAELTAAQSIQVTPGIAAFGKSHKDG